ncbi:hypothetical protein [Pseudomonas wadenswilerensis]|uniref:Uncharacterized protein n=1 Tax=Pseudomonas wadenswilerensis TaxID=1785161 RepID=A0A380T3L2_9PSED|nr:hypothetical protein [Pseudomonas wadenswilerensis]SUQ64190.1 hypothetical protein CCOS864_03645 [Pseudomonas wadenswilerensis]
MAFRTLDLHRVENCGKLLLEHVCDGFRVEVDDEEFHFGHAAVFYRGFFRPSNDPVRSRLLAQFIGELETGLQMLPLSCLVMNRPEAGIGNASKARHVAELAACGFRLPSTLVSNQADAVKLHVAPNAGWVNKGCSGIRTIAVAVGGPEVARLDLLDRCPTLFQQHVRGYDVRAHMVGASCVGLKIESDRVDYRYAKRQGGNIQVQPIEVPVAEQFRAIEYMHRVGLEFAGFDFKVDASGSWWLLEANPMPGFEFFDQFANDRIGLEVLQSLQANAPLPRRPVLDKPGELFIDASRVPPVDRAD